MKKLFRKEILIAVTVIISFTLLVVGIDFLKGVNVFKPANFYYTSYPDVKGLVKNAPVIVNGFQVGQVRDITYDYSNQGNIVVELSLDRSLKVPVGSVADITTDLLGTASVTLHLARPGRYLAVGDTIPGALAPSLMSSVTDNLLPQVGSIVPKVDTLLTSVNTIISDPALLAAVQRLNAITANLEASTAQLHSLMGTLPPISRDLKTLSGNLTASSADINVLTSRMASVPIDTIAANIAALSSNLRALSKELNNPNSSLGLLTRDPELYNNLNSAAAHLDSVLIDVKLNPKRYINIKVF